MLTLRHSPFMRACALVVILLFVYSCSKWDYYPNRAKVDLNTALLNQHVLFTEKEKTWDLSVEYVKYPIVRGPLWKEKEGDLYEVDLRRVTAYQIYGDNGPGDAAPLVDYNAKLNRHHVRLLEGDKEWDLAVKEVDYPMVRGPLYHDTKGPVQEVDLRNISGFFVYDVNNTAVWIAVVGVVALVTILIVANSGDDSPPPPPASTSGESCPVLYVCNANGASRVGEVYAGAAFRSVQRDDLLPLPARDGSTLRCLFVNEAKETQYTDALELVVVDHPRRTRAVATVQQAPILVGESRKPEAALDGAGANVVEAVATTDGKLWQTDWERVISATPAPLQESVQASFAAPSAGAEPVLELVLSNTYWLEFVTARLFTLTGMNFNDHMAQWNEPSNRAFVQAWLEREGVSLTVEQKRDGKWETVGVVPPVGAMELRRVAVPLPVQSADGGPIEVRVKGGTGFWQIDEMSLSARSHAKMNVQRIAPSVMSDENGEDQRALVAAADGRFQVMETFGERLPFDFEMPKAGHGERSLFLFTNGYYNVHNLAPDSKTPSAVAPVAARTGGLAALGIEAYREFQKMAADIPQRAGTVTTSTK